MPGRKKGTTSGLNHYYCCNPDGKQHLDYVLVSSRHKIPSLFSNRSLMGRLNEADESFGIFDMSDHEPVYARIEFPALSHSSESLVNCIGEAVNLHTILIKTGPEGRFQWYRNEDILAGANDSTLSITLNNSSDFATYTCKYIYDYIPDTSINNFFDSTYMDYHWVFRGTTQGEIAATFSIAPTDSSEDCFGLPTLLMPNYAKVPFNLYPNPAALYIDITCNELSGFYFEIIDIQGRKMQSQSYNLSSNTARINIKNLAPGSYFIRGSKNDKIYVLPFIKVR